MTNAGARPWTPPGPEGAPLPDFKGRAVHDFWVPYLRYDCDHAFCNAHLLRELVFLWEEHAQAWAKTMIDHLLAIKTAVDTARQAGQSARPRGRPGRGTRPLPRPLPSNRGHGLRPEPGPGTAA